MRFEVWGVSQWEVDAEETAGQEAKHWLIEPGGGGDLAVQAPTDKGGFRHGADWAERIARELALHLGIPCATVQLAQRDGQPGSISRDLKPEGWELQSGALLLAKIDPGYQPGQLKVKGRPGHSLHNINLALRGAAVSPSLNCPRHSPRSMPSPATR